MPKYTNYKSLHKQLLKKLHQNQSTAFGEVGRCNDLTLCLLIKEIRKNPQNLDPFISFTKTLDALYSTRLRTNRKGKFNDTIIIVAKVLKANWFKGAKLDEIRQRSKVVPNKVDMLREALREKLKKDYTSFATKVCHLMNDNYPIIDGRVQAFFNSKIKPRKLKFDYSTLQFSDFQHAFNEVIEELGWKKGIGNLDIAMWQYQNKKK